MGHVGGATAPSTARRKHAMEGFTKAMAIELGPHGIRVNTLCPTFIETPLTEPFFENKAFRDDTLEQDQARPSRPVEDIMGAVVFLASDAVGADDRHRADGRRRLDRGLEPSGNSRAGFELVGWPEGA